MPKFKISRFCTNPANRELCTTKSDRLGDKTRSPLSPKALTRRIPPKKHVFPSGNHRPDKRSFRKLSFLFFFLQWLTRTSLSFFLVGDSQKSKRVFLEVHAWLGGSVKVATFFCHQVGQIWSYRAVTFFPCSKSRDRGPEHGFRACSFKNKGKSWIFIFVVKTTKQKQKQMTKSVKCWSLEL